ncbi:c-type cytochrome [Flavobacteriaceae bacterium F89]|uniref:C-type cytochrome n=1 Tax=Cerina litoralis TaxID=2874477 RepID=A0AAE3JPK8_9FLAO|nr:c-type cytochrome [Cerina litoralis]MCG2462225.1 c-type cytochrome [Cerina litoralis]
MVKQKEEAIKRNTDTTIRVYGHYAAVKLPIKKGVQLWNPCAITKGPDGVMYAANYTGEIFSLLDTDGDGLEDYAKLYCNVKKDGLRYPTSIVFRDNELFVGTTQEIRVYEDTDSNGVADKSYTFFKDFPHTLHYFDWTFALQFGPEGNLYIILCTDALNDNPAPDLYRLRGAILKIASDGKSYERYATGLRYAYDLAFNEHGDLFFDDNRGQQNEFEELNLVVKNGFYGMNPTKYPDHSEPIGPFLKLRYGFAPVGMTFNAKDNDFDGTAGNLFISFYGPDGQWNDGSISRVKITRDNNTYKAEEFPVADKIAKLSDAEFGEQGDLYVTQFGTEGPRHTPYETPMGAVYRLIEADWIEPDDPKQNTSIVEGNVHHGESVFKERACVTCHSVSGKDELLGPSLNGIGKLLTREQILESITDPSRNIKTGYDHIRITKKNGTMIDGKMVTSNKNDITVMVVGNQEVKIQREDIKSNEMIDNSLMPEGLISGLDQSSINDLLGYLQSLKTDE